MINLIRQKFQPEHIVSLKLNAQQTWSSPESNLLSIFKHISSITFRNLSNESQILQYKQYFSNWICLTLYYDLRIDFKTALNIFNESSLQTKRLRLHGTGILCPHNAISPTIMEVLPKSTAQYFLLNISSRSQRSMFRCRQHGQLCVLKNVTRFLKSQRNFRYVTLIIHKNDIEQWLDVYEWENFSSTYWGLKKITLFTMGNISQREELIQKASRIQKALEKPGSTIKFQIKFR